MPLCANLTSASNTQSRHLALPATSEGLILESPEAGDTILENPETGDTSDEEHVLSMLQLGQCLPPSILRSPERTGRL